MGRRSRPTSNSRSSPLMRMAMRWGTAGTELAVNYASLHLWSPGCIPWGDAIVHQSTASTTRNEQLVIDRLAGCIQHRKTLAGFRVVQARNDAILPRTQVGGQSHTLGVTENLPRLPRRGRVKALQRLRVGLGYCPVLLISQVNEDCVVNIRCRDRLPVQCDGHLLAGPDEVARQDHSRSAACGLQNWHRAAGCLPTWAWIAQPPTRSWSGWGRRPIGLAHPSQAASPGC